ncbi:MAG: hypothetical protein HY854_09705 [Burkholderiales bacterium]|nr:hypothetical protein [Burkholderiales bacterium]
MNQPGAAGACCQGNGACVFTKAVLARSAECAMARRVCLAERDLLECSSPVARLNCETLAALLHERARFALKLPPPSRPLMHVQALRLQCGGLAALRGWLGGDEADVHAMVQDAQQRCGTLVDLPWDELVRVLAAWQRPRRGRF